MHSRFDLYVHRVFLASVDLDGAVEPNVPSSSLFLYFDRGKLGKVSARLLEGQWRASHRSFRAYEKIFMAMTLPHLGVLPLEDGERQRVGIGMKRTNTGQGITMLICEEQLRDHD